MIGRGFAPSAIGLMALAAAASGLDGGIISPRQLAAHRPEGAKKKPRKKRPFKGSRAAKKASRRPTS